MNDPFSAAAAPAGMVRHTPPLLSVLSEECFSRLVTAAPVTLHVNYLCGCDDLQQPLPVPAAAPAPASVAPVAMEVPTGDEDTEDEEASFQLLQSDYRKGLLCQHRLFMMKAEAVQQYIQGYLRRSPQGPSLQLGRIQSQAFKDAIYARCSAVDDHSFTHNGRAHLYPLFLAKFLIFNEFMDSLALPMSEMHNNAAQGAWLAKVCQEEYRIFHQPGPRQSITSFFLSRQSITSLELGFCDDTILAAIGENLWGLVTLKLTLSHHCSDVGLIWLMHKKVPDDYRKLRELSGSIISSGAKVGEDERAELAKVRKPGRVTLAELRSFVDCDRDTFAPAVKMRGCPFLKSLTLYGDVGCYELTESRTIMFRCGLHLIILECPELETFDIRLDFTSRQSSTSSSSGAAVAAVAAASVAAEAVVDGAAISNVIFQVRSDLHSIGYSPAFDLPKYLDLSFAAELTDVEIESFRHNFLPRLSALNVLDCGDGNILSSCSLNHLTTVMLLRVGTIETLLELLPGLPNLRSATLGVDIKSVLADLVALRNVLQSNCPELRRLHIVFEGLKGGGRVTLEPNRWVPDLRLSMRQLTDLHPNRCKDPRLQVGGRRRLRMSTAADKSLFREVFENDLLKETVSEIFAEASVAFAEVAGDMTSLMELELSGTFHWAQAYVFASRATEVMSLRINPTREFEVASFVFLGDLRMTLLPLLLALDPTKLRRICVGGNDELFCSGGGGGGGAAKLRELLQTLASSEHFSSLERVALGRSLYFGCCVNDARLRRVVRSIESGDGGGFRNSFAVAACNAQYDPRTLDAVAVKLEPSRFYLAPVDPDRFVY